MKVVIVFEFLDIDSVDSIEAEAIIDSLERDCGILAGTSNSVWIEQVLED